MTSRPTPNRHPWHPLALLVLTAVLALLAGPSVLAAPTVEELVAKGQALLAAGKPAKAAKQFRRAVEASDGEHFEALIGLAQASLRAGDSRDAVEAAQKVLATSLDPAGRLTAYQVLGSGHYDLATRSRNNPSRDLLEAAAEAYREAQALGRDRRVHTPSYSLALVLSELDDPAGARDILRSIPMEQLAPTVATQARQLLCRVKSRLPTEPLTREPVPWEAEGLWKPRRLTSLNPPMPRGPNGMLVEGDFRFQIVFDSEGCAHEVEVLEVPSLGPDQDSDKTVNIEPMLETLRALVYEPALLDGEPVPFLSKINFNTNIR